jgi:E3 ubiquitin-protein ligase DOA10
MKRTQSMEKIASGDQKEEVSCRICLDNEGAVYRVCDCQGGLGYMHMDCLQRWLQEKTNDRTANCEICKKPFKIRKARRFNFSWATACSRRSLVIYFEVAMSILAVLMAIAAFVVIKGTKSWETGTIVLISFMLAVAAGLVGLVIWRHYLR